MPRAVKTGTISCSWAKVGGFYVLCLAAYVLFITWDHHRRSSSHDVPSSTRFLLTAGKSLCKSASVVCGANVDFRLSRERLDTPPDFSGLNVVAIDSWTQTITQMKVYDPISQEAAANELRTDLEKLKLGSAVLVGVKNDGLELHHIAIEALRGIGASIVQEKIPGSYALIGVKGGTALAESLGSSVQAFGVLPCNGYQENGHQASPSANKATSEKIAEVVSLSPSEKSAEVASLSQIDEAMAIATFHATGCQNEDVRHDVLDYWRKEIPSKAFHDMLEYCTLVKHGGATKSQKIACCGGDGECVPESCTLQTQFSQASYNIIVSAKMPDDRIYLSTTEVGSMVDLFSSDDGSGRQRWIISKGSGDWYNIKVSAGVSGNRIYLGTTVDGSRVDLCSSDDGSGLQRWTISKGGGDWYNIQISAGVSGKRIYLSTNDDGSIVDLFSFDDGSGRQQWLIPNFLPEVKAETTDADTEVKKPQKSMADAKSPTESNSVTLVYPHFEAPSPLPPLQGPPVTNYTCVGGAGDRSCLFKNLYYYRGRFVMFVIDKIKDRIEVFRADKYEGLWKPDIEEFKSVQDIEKRLNKKEVIEERGLSVQFNPLFHHNIGHALFDGLYPAFLATVKLKVQDRPWRPVVAVDPGCFGDSATGDLKPGDSIEAYLPHPKFQRTLRTVRCKVVSIPKMDGNAKASSCDWKHGMDHNGLDLGSEHAGPPGNDQKKNCLRTCALTFGCKAGVLFADVCYLKGSGGNPYPKEERLLCLMKGSGPKPSIVVRADPDQGIGNQEVTIPEPWIVGKIRRRCMSEEIYEAFGGVGEIRRLFEIERDARQYPDLLLRFEEVVIGVGGAGNMIADRSGAIGGSLAPHNAMMQFRDRMLRSYQLPVESGIKPLSADDTLDVIVISNKRFSQQDWQSLNKIVDGLKGRGNVHAEIIDWGRIGNGKNKFKEHLKRTQKADVYISSIGTALQYVPFLRDGKIYIALGSVWMRSGQYFPTFMEQQLAGGGTPYLRTLYADPGKILRDKGKHAPLGEDGFFAGVDGPLVQRLTDEAEALARKGFEIPVPPEDNLSVEARILIEICKRDKEACDKMMKNRNGAVYECALLLWNEAVVYEVGPWRKGDKCGSAHHKLLRELRKEHGLPGYGAPEEP